MVPLEKSSNVKIGTIFIERNQMQYEKRRRASVYEKDLIEVWKKEQTFEQSIKQRPEDNSYVFYDGPPFITGKPHHGTLLSSIVKDAVPRYWTMQGKRVERVWGWDCHGLPAENLVEKQLDIKDRREIGTKISLEDYIVKARESMVANSATWEGVIDRVGRWVDFQGAYRTMDKNFMESVWWAFKQLYEAGKIFEGRKVLMYDTKFATPVSKSEVTMDNDAYQEVSDPSAYVKFKLKQKDAYLLAWTTTAWTLPANLILALRADLEYGLYEVGETKERLIVAVARAEELFGAEAQPLQIFKGAELVGLDYEPLLRNFSDAEKKEQTYTVLAADFVSAENGTGIVHCAPAYGEDDYNLAEAHEVDFVDVLDASGYYLPDVAVKLHDMGIRDTDEDGIQVWAANKIIAKVLMAQGVIWKIEYIRHEYPFNPRSKERIMYRAFPSWFFDTDGAKKLMLEQNENINWFPAHFKEGRFKKNIEQAPNWNLSRDRFWATAMPVWEGDKGSRIVVGSYQELKDLSGVELEDYHRPWVDEIVIKADEISDKMRKKYAIKVEKGETFRRIEKVLDCWFESGSMPFAQMHYPFENKQKFEHNYPADFIVEYVGQIRAWFYYVHSVNTALAEIGAFGKDYAGYKDGQLNAYKNVIVTGTIAGNDGRKMSKSLGNYTDPMEMMEKYSADALRLLMLSSPALSGEDFALIDKDVSDVARKLTMIWNVYDFFATYANVDGFEGKNDAKSAKSLQLKNKLDIWIVSRIFQLRNEIVDNMVAYDLPTALAGVLPFVDDLSNWFVRRSRRRFWKSGNSADKMEAYETLYFVLSYLAQIIAPFVPFLSEELWHKLGNEKSVHLCDYPEAGEIDQQVLRDMAETRAIISEALALRAEKNDGFGQIKVRQPLARLTYVFDSKGNCENCQCGAAAKCDEACQCDDCACGAGLDQFYEEIIADEVNVKEVKRGEKLWLDKTLTEELRAEGRMRELIRFVQNLRKKSGLEVDDRIRLAVHGLALGGKMVEKVKQETLAEEYGTSGNYAFDEIVEIDGRELTISLEKFE